MLSFTVMRYLKSILVFSLVLVVNFSCSKGGSGTDDPANHINNPNDIIPPVITVNSPVPDQVFNSGNTINISGRITDDLGLYRGTIRIINDANGAVVKEQQYEIHGLPAYDFNVNHVAVVSTASDYTVSVWFEDHGYNSVTKTVKIKVNP